MDISGFINGLIASPLICIGWIIVGAIAGAIARSLMRTGDRPFIEDVILGIVGALLGGFLVGLLFGDVKVGTWGLERVLINLVIATIGAMVIIFLGRMIRRA